VLQELEKKIAKGEDVVFMTTPDALERDETGVINYKRVTQTSESEEEKKETAAFEPAERIELPGAACGSNAREVICAVRKGHVLCTAFHPELTEDFRWHQYFVSMVNDSLSK